MGRMQQFFAHGFKAAGIVGGFVFAIPIACSCGGFSVWAVLAAFFTFLLGSCLGMIFLWPLIWRLGLRFNGAPFQEGDSVQILIGPHRGFVTRIYELWPTRGQVRVDLGEQAKKEVKDVFLDVQVCRAQED